MAERGLERLRQPLLAGAVLRRRGRGHPVEGLGVEADADWDHLGTVRDRTLEITFVEPGAEAYAFTFG
jgi:hypothetical protein